MDGHVEHGGKKNFYIIIATILFLDYGLRPARHAEKGANRADLMNCFCVYQQRGLSILMIMSPICHVSGAGGWLGGDGSRNCLACRYILPQPQRRGAPRGPA